MGFFMKDRKVFGMSFLARMMVAVLVVGIVGVSGSILKAGWVDDNAINSNEVIYTEAGKVGIGTMSPSQKLDISGNLMISGNSNRFICMDTKDNSDNSGLYFKGAGTNRAYIMAIGTGNESKGYVAAGYGGTWSNNRIDMFHNGSDGILSTEAGSLTFKSATGFVGINTSSIFTPLSFGFSINTGKCQYPYNSNGNRNDVLSIFENSSEYKYGFGIHSGAMEIFAPTNKSIQLGIRSDTTDTVNGPGYFTPIMTMNSNGVSITSKVSASSYACTSDSRFKKNITLYQNALEKILGLRGVTFFWNTEKYKDRSFGKEKQVGFIAQEVEKVIPEIVYTDEKGIKTMSYDRLTAVLVEAVKELKAEKDGEIAKSNEKIKTLENEIVVVKSENEVLKQRLAKFESLADRLALIEKELEKRKGRRFAER